MNITNAKEIPYFDRLPRFAMPALQAAWDRAHNRTVGAHAIYIGFCRDMEFIGYEKPTTPVMNEWIDKVEQGLIERPLPTEDDKRQEVQEAAEVPAIEGMGDAPSEWMADGGAQANPMPKGKAEAQYCSRSDFLSPTVDAELSQPFFSPAFPADVSPIDPMAKDLRAISSKMLDELVAEFEANARRHATTLIVGILRDLASEMEGAA